MTYVLTIFCDHSRHGLVDPVPPRLVTRITYAEPPVDTDTSTTSGFLTWREVPSDDPVQPPALQTYFGEADRLGRTPTNHAADDLVRNMEAAQRWRFYCADCGDTIPARHVKVVTLFEGLMRHGVDTLSMSGLAARVQ